MEEGESLHMATIARTLLAAALYIHQNNFSSPEARTRLGRRKTNSFTIIPYSIWLSLYSLIVLPPALSQMQWPGFMLAESQQLWFIFFVLHWFCQGRVHSSVCPALVAQGQSLELCSFYINLKEMSNIIHQMLSIKSLMFMWTSNWRKLIVTEASANKKRKISNHWTLLVHF